jgi:hypothetical protein
MLKRYSGAAEKALENEIRKQLRGKACGLIALMGGERNYFKGCESFQIAKKGELRR